VWEEGREGGREGEVQQDEGEEVGGEEKGAAAGKEESVEVAIVGAGFAGICLAVKLKEVREGGREAGRKGGRNEAGDINSISYCTESFIPPPLLPSLPIGRYGACTGI